MKPGQTVVMERSAYGWLLAIFAGVAVLAIYLRFAEWFDDAVQLGFRVPFYFSYLEGIIWGGLLAVCVSMEILFIVSHFEKKHERPDRVASLVLVTYFTATAIVVVTQPAAYDPGLITCLSLVGFVTSASTYLHFQNLRLQTDVPRGKHRVKWIELAHKETMDILSTLTWGIVFSYAGVIYASTVGFWQDLSKYESSNLSVVWRIVTTEELLIILLMAGITWFMIAPLFRRLEILKEELTR